MAGELTVGDLLLKVSADLDALKREILTQTPKVADQAGAKAGKSFGARFKQQMTAANIGKGLVQGLGLGAGLSAVNAISAGIGKVTDAIGGAFDAAAKYEDRLATINTIARLDEVALGDLGDEIQDLAIKAGKSTDDLATGFYDLVSAGIASADAMGVLEDATILSIGALSTTAQAVDLLTTAINAFGLKASDSSRLIDIFAQAVEEGKVTADQIAASLAQVAPIAAEAGVSVEEVAAAYARMTSAGVPAAELTQNLRQAIVALLSPNSALNKIQRQTGINFAELMRAKGVAVALQTLREAVGGNTGAMQKALGRVQALQVALLVTGDNADDFAGSLERMQAAGDNGGVALAQMAQRADTAAFKQRRLDAAVEVLNQRMGAFLLGTGGDFLEWLANIIGGTPRATDELRAMAERLGIMLDEVDRAADVGERLERIPGMGDWFGIDFFPHETELAIMTDRLEVLAAHLGITRGELRLLLEQAKKMGLPLDEVEHRLGAWSLAQARVNETMRDGLARLSPQRWGVYIGVVEEATVETSRFGRVIDVTADAQRAARRSAIDLNEALELVADRGLRDVRKEAKAAERAWRDLADGPDENRRSIRQLEGAVARWGARYKRHLASGRSDLAAFARVQHEQAISELADRRAVQAELRDQEARIKDVKRALETVPAKTVNRIVINGGEQALATIEAIIAATRTVQGMYGSGGVDLEAAAVSAYRRGQTGGRRKRRRQRQHGGEVVMGELYQVNEADNAPSEWFAPKVTGTVLTAAQMSASGRAVSPMPTPGGTEVHLAVHGLPMVAETPVDVLHQTRRAARLGYFEPSPRPAWSGVP